MPRPDVSIVQANTAFPEDALIIVYSSLDNLSFRSSVGAVDRQYYNARANRYEILVKPLKQMIFISASEYMEQKIATINPKPKEDYYFKVEEKLSVLNFGKGNLSINSDPIGADIYINNLKLSDKTPASFEYPAGNATIKLIKSGFIDKDTLIRIKENNKLNCDFKLLSNLPVVKTISIDSITSNSAIVSGKALFNGGSPIIEQGICWSRTPNPTLVDNSKKLTFESNVFNGIVSELRSNTIYYFRAFAKNKNGISYGNEVTVKTLVLKGSGYVSDIDGNVYSTINIGNQVWMTENLKTEHYNNGAEISKVIDVSIWANLKTGAWCNYDNLIENDKIYGKLYNWYAVVDTRNLCPTGWHIPTDREWKILTDFLGGEEVAGGKMKKNGLQYWESPNNFANNESGFAGLPGGYRSISGSFDSMGNFGYWWSSSENDLGDALDLGLGYVAGSAYQNNNYKQAGSSVRCLKD